MSKWESLGGLSNNEVLKGDGFYVSFTSTGALSFMSFFASDGNGPETALCKGGKFYILNGDWRKKYEALVPHGFKACKQLFDDNQHAKSSWSS